MITYDELTQKYNEKYSTRSFPFYADDFKKSLYKRIHTVYYYLQDRAARMSQKCAYCGNKSALDNCATTISNIKAYNDIENKEYYFCSDHCREHFEEDYVSCECGRYVDHGDIWCDAYTTQCTECKSYNVFDNGMNYDDIKRREWWLHEWVYPIAHEKVTRQMIKNKWKLYGLCGSIDFIYDALEKCDIQNEDFLVVPYKKRYCIYLKKEDIDSLEIELRRIKLKSLLRV